MILADTSVWIQHLRSGHAELEALLDQGQVLMHPAGRGELSMANLPRRREILTFLHDLPSTIIAGHDEVAAVESVPLHGRGIGYVDAWLLTSTLLTPETLLWSRDRRLHAAAIELGCAP